ncbi:hypothetical protein SMACR_06388 [Sordaria macrospora]|uniref:WGS project CABT00000000 data, contig 2.35 n=2 Tax=Sordaria macrospora TaxID=5147 RepID=F7W6N0_SORMK|nr:uncharacterized protein SMAC_06388 [Sordaria macrospora k-hell]KAA8629996.1 hypothetical protein SMACR_06388 [Sordaria macrospora]WPJ65703.1 hypothetical protein SMAC4_06388 [Sordaria macrospora]CCC13169.1 unnamed protein product [Sordaria macrospora k-hell]
MKTGIKEGLPRPLVTVLLRVLEYYNGVLFLTTNRIGDFDEVFASRVHVSLYYPHLDLQSTPKIFELNLERIVKQSQEKNRAITIDQEKIMQFIHLHWESKDRMRWNGRQIRNGCQTALALAEFEAQGGNLERVVDANAEVKITYKHIRIVSKSYREFNHYLERVYDRDLDRRAKYMGIRARDIGATSGPFGFEKQSVFS